MRQRVHFLHHQRGYVKEALLEIVRQPLTIALLCSIGKMPTGKAKDGEWGRHPFRHELARLRELRRSSENLPCKVSRSEFCLNTHPAHLLCHWTKEQHSEHRTDWDETQSARGENQNRPTSSGASGASGGYAAGGPVGGTTGNPAATQSSVFSAGAPETAGTILSPTHGLDTSEHDATEPYVYPGMVSTTGHNGTGAESY